jgi:VanZ family protein
MGAHPPHWFRIVARVGGYLGLVAIAVLSLVPGSSRPHTGWGGTIDHVVAYAFVSAAFALGYTSLRARLSAVGLLMIGAATLEALQHLVPGRTPAINGFVASVVGTWIGLGLVVITFSRARQRRN